MSYLSHKRLKTLCRVWIRLLTANLLCTQEFRQNNALALQFWYLSSILILLVCALDASKTQCTCIILSKFTGKVICSNLSSKGYFCGNFFVKCLDTRRLLGSVHTCVTSSFHNIPYKRLCCFWGTNTPKQDLSAVLS